jgi:SAM-dependent methyltransferase/glycosyltransferase involved in cell wall biosynthesis
MKILVDCVPMTVGGGIQAAVAFLVILRGRSDVAWKAVAGFALERALPPEVAADPRIIFLRRRSALDRIWLCRKLQRIEREFEPDVVFTLFGPAMFRARSPQVAGFALPHLIYDADRDVLVRRGLDRFSDWLRCVTVRQSDHVVVETQTVRTKLAQRLAIDPAKISVIPNSVNPIIMQYVDDEGFPDKRFAFLVPSAYYPHKNLEIVPAVAAAIQRLGPDVDFEFRLTLNPNEGPWRTLSSEAARLGVADRLVTLGVLRLEKLAKAYRAASAVFLPTLREASSAVYPESFAMRRPLVTSDLDFARELCGDAALYVPPLDAQAIAGRLIELARSPQLQLHLVEAGKQQLARGYPDPDEKFAMQMELLHSVARDRYFSVQAAPSGTSSQFAGRGCRLEETGSPSKGATRNPTVAFHDVLAPQWDAKYKSGGFLRRANFFKQQILPLVTGNGHWLDAGCGSGYFARLLGERGMRVTGVDGSASMIGTAVKLAREAKLSGLLDFQQIDLRRLPFADHSFAGCLCLSVLEYFDEPYESLEELTRVVEPGGRLILSVPARYSAIRLIEQFLLRTPLRKIARKLQYNELSKYSTTVDELREALRRRGFRLGKVVAFDPLIPAQLMPSFACGLLFAVAVKSA